MTSDNDFLKEYFFQYSSENDSTIAKNFLNEHSEHDLADLTHNALRKRIARIRSNFEKSNPDSHPKESPETPLESTISSKTSTNTSEGVLYAIHPDSGSLMDIYEYCKYWGIDESHVKSYKLITHVGGVPYYNIQSNSIDVVRELEKEDFLEDIVKKHINPIKIEKPSELSSETFDRLVVTDVHIGMNPNEKGNSMFPDLKWDKEELMSRTNKMIGYVMNRKRSNVLFIDLLGDILDGWNSETTRGGHTLPQNMDNKEQFDTGVEFIMILVDNLVEEYDHINLNLVCNDNHGGAFSYTVNSAIDQIIKYKYPDNVTVKVIKEFFGNYSIANHNFILSHGKDETHMKFGMKPFLDNKSYDIINSYAIEQKLYQDGKYLHFSKGDSHVGIKDHSNPYFSYKSYPAFSVASGYVQGNFGRSRSGFVFESYDYFSDLCISDDYWF